VTGTAERDLRIQVRAALDAAGISQAEACRQLGLSTKHVNMILTGKATLTLDWAERIVDLCDMRLVVLALTGRTIETETP
jgi:plasmid maintenance system antidote protein VapI